MADYASCLRKQAKIKALFKDCISKELVFEKIIDLGKSYPKKFLSIHRTEENIIKGCQSIVYLYTELKDGKLFFSMDSEALISRGLATLLIMAYNDESPETLLKCPPNFLEELGIPSSLTPGRSNGLASMILRMQQDATKYLLISSN